MSYPGSHTYATLSGRTLEFLLSGPKTDKEIRNHLRSTGGAVTDAKVDTVIRALENDQFIYHFKGAEDSCFISDLSTNGIVLATLIKLERIAILHADAFLINQIAKARKETAALLRKP